MSPKKPQAGDRLRTPVALRDVAARAAVHPSTASRALNPRTRSKVSLATVARVQEAADTLGYRPNSLARGLRMKRTFTVGMLVPDLMNPLFPPIVRGIEDRLSREGFTLVLGNTDNDPDKERAILDAMGLRRVDALILATALRRYPILDEIVAAGMPVVLVNRTADEAPVPSVASDDHAGIGLAVRHLVSLGHRHIAYVGGPLGASTGLIRSQAFVSWLASEGLRFDPELAAAADWFREESGREALEQVLASGREFTAVVAANDLIALGCYDVLGERGLRIPGDVSVVGYNGMPFSDKFAPPLTTIRIPLYEIGVQAGELALRAIEGSDQGGIAVRLPPGLVVRASTAPPGAVAR